MSICLETSYCPKQSLSPIFLTQTSQVKLKSLFQATSLQFLTEISCFSVVFVLETMAKVYTLLNHREVEI